jgi:hypothetical protein
VTRFFYSFATGQQVPFAVVSDRYGLHFSDERRARYDIHPSSLSDEERRRLGKLIGKQARARKFSTLVFYNNSPMMSWPYFDMLAASGLGVFYTTRLPENVSLTPVQ